MYSVLHNFGSMKIDTIRAAINTNSITIIPLRAIFIFILYLWHLTLRISGWGERQLTEVRLHAIVTGNSQHGYLLGISLIISAVACSLVMVWPSNLSFSISNISFDPIYPFSGVQNRRLWFGSSGILPIALKAYPNPETQIIVWPKSAVSNWNLISGFQASVPFALDAKIRIRLIAIYCSFIIPYNVWAKRLQLSAAALQPVLSDLLGIRSFFKVQNTL